MSILSIFSSTLDSTSVSLYLINHGILKIFSLLLMKLYAVCVSDDLTTKGHIDDYFFGDQIQYLKCI